MTRPRTSFSSGLVMASVAAATTWVAMLSWDGLTATDSDYVGPLMVLGATVAVSGAVARWWRLPAVLVVLAQLALSALVLSFLLTGSLLPVQGAWRDLVTAFGNAVDSAQEFEAPVPRQAPGIHPLLIAGGLACMLLVDLLACTARRVPLAGLPLLTIYTVPITLLGSGVSLWVFVPTAVGFLTLLFLHEDDLINRWGRPVDEDAAAGSIGSFGVRTGTARANAGAIGTIATGLAIVVPLGIPTLDVRLLDFGAGGGGDSKVEIDNPTADLLRDLSRGEDIPLIRVTTDDPEPDYLRVTALTRFSENEWSPGDRDSPSSQRADGEMPPLAGVSPLLDRREYSYEVSINDDFDADWLPTQFPISSIEAEGDWRYDESTMDFFGWENGLDTRGMDYWMTAVELDLRGEELADAPASVSQVSPTYRENPDDLPPVVRSSALSATADADTRFDKAVALQNWFRANFEYSLQDGPRGTGADDLEVFLTPGEDGRVGYCEQFAAAMAVLAREIGLPARVAVGFLQPRPLEPGTWEYSAHDLHAWTEVFFDGYGWVRFEPTPRRAASAPAYTEGRGVGAGGPTELPSVSGSVENPRVPASERPSAQPRPEEDSAAADQDASFPWAGLTLGGGGVVVALLLALTPRMLRARLRQRRLVGGPESVWSEIRATVLDLRRPWPGSRSPRETRDRLVELFGGPAGETPPQRPARGLAVNPEAVAAIDRIVGDLERLRYSRSPDSQTGHLQAQAATCVAALEAGVPARVRRRAVWLPASLVRRSAREGTERTEEQPELTPAGGVVEHVG